MHVILSKAGGIYRGSPVNLHTIEFSKLIETEALHGTSA